MVKDGVNEGTKGREDKIVGLLGWVNGVPKHILRCISTYKRVWIAQNCRFNQTCAATPTSPLLKTCFTHIYITITFISLIMQLTSKQHCM